MSLKSVAMFKQMEPLLATHGADMVKKVGCAYHFELRAKKGDKPVYITLDLKSGNGKIAEGKVGKADCTFVILDADFMALAGGKLKPQEAFMNGKMKIKGNMAKAMKFNPSILPKDAKL
mmetsp:Transcript_84637/g.116914  ORF Transcript_84637/g.116914 Transcript_84637/m.116914 type:complete len:119 (-) Transcript_84637:127-483(-)